jgi:hypothetical protein
MKANGNNPNNQSYKIKKDYLILEAKHRFPTIFPQSKYKRYLANISNYYN